MKTALTYLKRFGLALSLTLYLAACSGIVSVEDAQPELPQGDSTSKVVIVTEDD